MDNLVLFEHEAKRRRNGLEILAELDLLNRWKPFGEPVLVGALSYGLAVAPDIDLEIYCPDDPRIEDGFEVLRACALNPHVRAARFGNHLDEPDQGYYWQLRYRADDGTLWKVDMWSVRHDHPGPTSRDMVEPMNRTLTDETRAAILTIKEAVLAQPVLNCPSIHIYQAVLQAGVRTLPEFLEWRERSTPIGLIAWRPD